MSYNLYIKSYSIIITLYHHKHSIDWAHPFVLQPNHFSMYFALLFNASANTIANGQTGTSANILIPK